MIKSEVQNVANWTINPLAFTTGTVPTVVSVAYNEVTRTAHVVLSGPLLNIQMGSISTGPNGVAESTALLTDAQVIQLGNGAPNTACVTAIATHVVSTIAAGDDNPVILAPAIANAGQTIIDTGGNGICETAYTAVPLPGPQTEVQTVPLTQGTPNQTEITAGVGFILHAVPAGDDVLTAAPIFVTVSGVHDVATNAIRSNADSIGTDGTIQ
jgi:hypothetical protein